MGQRVWARSAGWKRPLKQMEEALKTGMHGQAGKGGQEGLMAHDHREVGNQVRRVSDDEGTEEGSPADARWEGEGRRWSGRDGGKKGSRFQNSHRIVCRWENRERQERGGSQLVGGGTEEPGAGSTVHGVGGCDGVSEGGQAGVEAVPICGRRLPWWCVHVRVSLSRVQLFATPWTVAHQAPLSVGFSRQEY